MTDKQLEALIYNHLRRIGYRNVTRKEVEAAARISRGNYRCEKCMLSFKRQLIDLDHIEPVVNPHEGMPRLPNGKVDWNPIIERLFWGQLQALCTECHKQKSSAENLIRREVKKK